jgi:hypothetical protein
MTIPSTNGHLNGHTTKATTTVTNGHSEESSSIQSSSHYASQLDTRSIASSGYTHTFTSDQQVNIMRRTVISTRAKIISDLSHVDNHYIDSMTVESILDYVGSERLTYMPQRGSRWDKVLKWAEFFSLQISGYEKAVSSFVPDSKGAAQLIWACCRILLEVSILLLSIKPVCNLPSEVLPAVGGCMR